MHQRPQPTNLILKAVFAGLLVVLAALSVFVLACGIYYWQPDWSILWR